MYRILPGAREQSLYLPSSPLLLHPVSVSSTLGSSNEVPSVFELLGIKSSKAGWRQGWERHQQGNSSLLYEKQLQLCYAAAICIPCFKRSLSVRGDGRSGCRHHLPGFAGWWQLETLSPHLLQPTAPHTKQEVKMPLSLK